MPLSAARCSARLTFAARSAPTRCFASQASARDARSLVSTAASSGVANLGTCTHKHMEVGESYYKHLTQKGSLDDRTGTHRG